MVIGSGVDGHWVVVAGGLSWLTIGGWILGTAGGSVVQWNFQWQLCKMWRNVVEIICRVTGTASLGSGLGLGSGLLWVLELGISSWFAITSTFYTSASARVLNLLVTLPASNLPVIYRKITGKLPVAHTLYVWLIKQKLRPVQCLCEFSVLCGGCWCLY